jgi:spore maturation protein CgeB
MRVVVFGLTVSSSWGNGHATVWRALGAALAARGHQLVFFERDVPYYARARDPGPFRGIDLRLYGTWPEVRREAARALANADAGLVTSYCPDARDAAALLLDAPCQVRGFYDMDTPVTLARLAAGSDVDYVPSDGLRGFDLVLSFTGGPALAALRDTLGARRTAPLYGSVDPDAHVHDGTVAPWAALSYLGTYAEDRQPALEALFLAPARARSERPFVLGGSQYPAAFPWPDNVHYRRHVAPGDHPRFYREGRLTLNVTRAAMARMGYCPSGRLFEAAACGTPIITDPWPGLDTFFTPGEEILVAGTTAEALLHIDGDDASLAALARRARERTLQEHTSARRALEFEVALAGACRPEAREDAT